MGVAFCIQCAKAFFDFEWAELVCAASQTEYNNCECQNCQPICTNCLEDGD